MRLMSAQVPNRESMSSYVSGAKPRSPDDGNGGRMWTPRNNPSNGPSRRAPRVGRFPPSESGYVRSWGRAAMPGDAIASPVPSGADRGAQGHRELACPCITVTAHLVAQIGESDVV